MQIWAQKEHVIFPLEALNVSTHRFRLETWQGLFWLWFFLPPCHPVSIIPPLHVLFPCIWFIDIHDFHIYTMFFIFVLHTFLFFLTWNLFWIWLVSHSFCLIVVKGFFPHLCRAGVCVCNLPFLFYNLKSSYVALRWNTDISFLKIQFNNPLKMS